MFEANPPPARSEINLYFDIVSPFSYLAFTVAQHYAPLWRSQGYAVHYVPVYQAAIMTASGNSPPMAVPAKAAMSRRDLARWSRLLGLTTTQPAKFPVNSLLCARTLAVIHRHHPAKMAAAMTVLWQGYWGGSPPPPSSSPPSSSNDGHNGTKGTSGREHGGRDISDPADLTALLSRVFTGSEVEIMLKLARADHFKYVVRENTRKAVGDGCFGCPWIEVVQESGETQHFFGNDRWPQVVEYAGLSWHGYTVVGGRERSSI